MKTLKKAIVIITLTLAFFTLAACSDQNNTWTIDEATYDDANSTKRETFVNLTLSPSENYEIWVKVADVKGDDAVIKAAAAYSTANTFYAKTPDVTVTKKLIKDTNGWIRLRKDVSKSYTLIDLASTDAMSIYEIVVCDEKGEVYPLTFKTAGYRVSRDRKDMRSEFTDEDYAAMKTGSPKNVLKANSEFDRATAIAAYERATASDSSADSSK